MQGTRQETMRILWSRDLVVLWSGGLWSGVVPLRSLEEKLTLTCQRYVILDAENNGHGSLKVETDSC